MKLLLTIVGGLLCLAGAVWVLQGLNILPGSFMTGQIRWAIIGAITVAAGVVLILWGRRRR